MSKPLEVGKRYHLGLSNIANAEFVGTGDSRFLPVNIFKDVRDNEEGFLPEPDGQILVFRPTLFPTEDEFPPVR